MNESSLQDSNKAQAEQNVEQVRRFHATHKIITILTQSKANIEYLIDHLPDIFAIIDQNGYICRGNYRLADIFGIHIEKLLGAKFSQLFKDTSWVTFKNKLKEVQTEKRNTDFELSCDANPYKVLNVNWRINEFFSHRKSKRMFCVMGTDITTLRAREKELEDLTGNLKDLVEEKTRNISVLLNSIKQGIFSIGKNMTLTEAHSKHAEIIFNTDKFENRPISDVLNLSEDEQKDFKKWLKLLDDPKKLKRWQKYLPLNPVQERIFNNNNEKRIVKIDYQPIIEDERFDQLMILCTDVTDKIKAEDELKKAEKQNELKMQRILGFVNNMQISLKIFLDETKQYLNKFSEINQYTELIASSEEFYRHAHTIKGNAGTFGFHELSRFAGDLEDVLQQILKKSQDSDQIKNYTKWQRSLNLISNEFQILLKVKEKIFHQSTNRIGIISAEYEQLLSDIKSQKINSIDEIYSRIINLKRQPFAEFCQKYNNIVKMYRVRLGKNISDLKIENSKTLVHKELIAKIDTPVLHIIRNAIDHGIESNDQRENAGKGEGSIKISYDMDKRSEIVTISDDGGGIDVEAVAKRAIKLGIVTEENLAKMIDQEKINLIFHTGFSTKNVVSSLSGRGAGLGAAKEHMKSHGGTLEIKTEKGSGTTFILKIPLTTQILTKKSP